MHIKRNSRKGQVYKVEKRIRWIARRLGRTEIRVAMVYHNMDSLGQADLYGPDNRPPLIHGLDLHSSGIPEQDSLSSPG